MSARPEAGTEAMDRSWAVAGHGGGLLAGPLRALRDVEPHRATVTLLPHGEPLAIGAETARIEDVRESGVRTFAVSWHDGADGLTVADNPAGANRVAWTADATSWWLTSVDDGPTSVVHLRFVLRHITTTCLIADTHGRAVHAVTVRLRDGGLLAIVGATTSGKTRLANRLLVSGAAGPVVDDDCPVIAADGRVHTLVPARHEVVRASEDQLRALVVLRSEDTDAKRTPSTFVESVATPWPARWLPSPGMPPLPALPVDLPVLELPERADDDRSFERVISFVEDAP